MCCVQEVPLGRSGLVSSLKYQVVSSLSYEEHFGTYHVCTRQHMRIVVHVQTDCGMCIQVIIFSALSRI